MIEFTLNRNRNGKKSRWAKKYPRKSMQNECEGYTHVFSLRGENIVTRGLLKVKNLLCKRV